MADFFARLGAGYIDKGYPIIPILPQQKRPRGEQWQAQRLSREDHARMAANGCARDGIGLLCGVLLAGHDVAIYGADVDSRHDGVARQMSTWMLSELGATVERIGQAPKRCAIYAGVPGWVKRTSRVFWSPGHEGEREHRHQLEWLGAGQQFVLHGIHPDTGAEYQQDALFGELLDLDVADIPVVSEDQMAAAIAAFEGFCRAAGLVEGRRGGALVPLSDVATGTELDWTDRPDVSLEQVREALWRILDTVDDYEQWVRVGAALHYQAGGERGDWLDLWDAWSQEGASYQGRDDIEGRWRSFVHVRGDGKKPVTVASILKQAREVDARERYDTLAALRQSVQDAPDERALREHVCRDIAKAEIERIDREGLAAQIQARWREITGHKPPIAAVRELIQPPAHTTLTAGTPTWAWDWVWSTEDDAFFNIGTKESYTKQSFDAAYNREFDVIDGDGQPVRVSAAQIVLDIFQAQIVSGLRYMPGYDATLTIDGRRYANTYRADGIPVARAESIWTDDDRAAVAAVERHIELLIPDARHRADFVAWLAWCVRNPGKKVQWAPLIKGIEGDGKSVLGRLMAAMMGHHNTRILSPETLTQSSFTGWAEGSCLIVIEELMIQGHNRHEVVNKLKPVVTNSHIEVHRKGMDPYTAPNTANLMAFTNFPDALPLLGTDRRWFVLFSPWVVIEDLWAAVGDADAYWERLWGAIERHADALRGWIDAIDLSGFNPHRRAPATEYKAEMVAAEVGDMELALADILDEEAVGRGRDGIILMSVLSAEIESRVGERCNGRRMARMMADKGYKPHPATVVKVEGRTYRLYVHATSQVVTTKDVIAKIREAGGL